MLVKENDATKIHPKEDTLKILAQFLVKLYIQKHIFYKLIERHLIHRRYNPVHCSTTQYLHSEIQFE